jgi:hypothetical protein
MLVLGAMATPALADTVTMPAERPLAWGVAPWDNAPNQPLMFLGLAKVEANESTLDRALRLVAGAGLVYLAAANPSGMPQGGQIAAGAAGGILGLTGLSGYCALYQPFGINTR